MLALVCLFISQQIARRPALDGVAPFASPTDVTLDANGGMHITLCLNVNLTADPTLFPFHNDLAEASGCEQGTYTRTFSLESLAAKIEAETNMEQWHVPLGILIHAMRVGSTAAANMVGGHEDVVVLKEPKALTDILLMPVKKQGRARRDKLLALRLMVHVFFRSAASQRLAISTSRGHKAAVEYAGRTGLALKLSSAGTARADQLNLLREAFPDVPFAYLIRDPVASVASLTAPQPAPDKMLASPCLRWRSRPAKLQLPTLLRRANATDPLSLSLEQYCAAHLAAMHSGMMAQIVQDGGIHDLQRRSLVVDHSTFPDSVVTEIMPHFGIEVDDETRMRSLELGSVNAKNANERGYRSKEPSEPARRWALAYAGLTYVQLRQLSSSPNTSLTETTAMAAMANESTGIGMLAHTAGLNGITVPRECNVPLQTSFVHVAEHGMHLYRSSDIYGAEACWIEALKRSESSAHRPAVDASRSAILINLMSTENVLSRRERQRIMVGPASDGLDLKEESLAGARRAHQKAVKSGLQQVWRKDGRALQESTESTMKAAADPAIAVYDHVLSDELCDAIVELFDGPGQSEHYTGNVGTDSGFVIKPEAKLDTEIDISHSPRSLWDGVDVALVQALVGALNRYANANPGLTTPFQWSDEGFRLKRYDKRTADELDHHHAWHSDAGSSCATGCRAIAVLFYFSDVDIGGETVFSSPHPLQVAPRKGRLLLFPASHAYHHTGAVPISHAKYIASNFLSPCSPTDQQSFPPFPALSLERRHALRASKFATAPPSQLRISAKEIIVVSGETWTWGTASRASEAEKVNVATRVEKAGVERLSRVRVDAAGSLGEADFSTDEEAVQNIDATGFLDSEGAASQAEGSSHEGRYGEGTRGDAVHIVPSSTERVLEPSAALGEHTDMEESSWAHSSQCGARFLNTVAYELDALQNPGDCTAAPLLVCGTSAKDFEGFGSVMMQIAHAYAEAYYSNRTVIWGPRAAQPLLFAGAQCNGAGGHDCYFKPLSRCAWEEHVFREEAMRFSRLPSSDDARVSLQSIPRGALALYSVPPRLQQLLPLETRRSPAAAAECWAGGIFARVFRLNPSTSDEIQKRVATILPRGIHSPPEAGTPGMDTPSDDSEISATLTSVHLRHGDVQLLADVYTNRQVPSARQLAQSLTEMWERAPKIPRSSRLVYLASDAQDIEAEAALLSDALGGQVKVITSADMFRTSAGSHTAAFAKDAIEGRLELSLPYDMSIEHARHGDEKERVRREALLDLYLLATSRGGLTGAASSTFAVSARLWGVGMRSAPSITYGVQWTDIEGVVSGELATGYMRGMRNGTKRLSDGGERHRTFVARMLGRHVQHGEPPLKFDARTGIPLVPGVLIRSASAAWSKRMLSSSSNCACNPLLDPAVGSDGACDYVELVNRGAEYHDGALMNWQEAQRCWRLALMLPSRTKHLQFHSPAAAVGGVLDVARTNLILLLAKHEQEATDFFSSATDQPRRGGVLVQNRCSSTGHPTSPESIYRIHIEGWRGIPHSYAVAANDLMAELSKRCAVKVTWADAPMPDGLKPTTKPRLPKGVETLPYGAAPEGATIFRIAWPYNLSSPHAKSSHAIVFATAEYLRCPDELSAGSPRWHEPMSRVTLLTPTLWSLEGLVQCGVKRQDIGVVPHGVRPALLSEEAGRVAGKMRESERSLRGWEGRFVFLHIGAATPNKNLPTLVQSYVAMLHRFLDFQAIEESPKRRKRWRHIQPPLLVIKGLDGLYKSREAVVFALNDAFADQQLAWTDHVQFIGDDLNVQQMAALYSAADAYVTASMAEAFQMPLAEAMAAGLPIISPAGGAAEEVVNPSTAVLVPSIMDTTKTGNHLLRVDVELLSTAMEAVHRNTSIAVQRGPDATKAWTKRYLSIAHSADMLLSEVMRRKTNLV